MNRKRFFDVVRGPLFSGSMTSEQVQHVEAILDACTAAGWPLAWTAYGLATAKWETGHFIDLTERGGAEYFKRMYDPLGARPDLARRMGNTTPGDGARYRGRGYVHLTWKSNYARAGRLLGVDLVGNPDLARRPDIAAKILISGMRDGWFTGKKMADYLSQPMPDYLNARRIINGTDKAATIAFIARTFESALRQAGYGAVQPAVEPAPAPGIVAPPPAAPPADPPPAPAGFWARFWAALGRRLP